MAETSKSKLESIWGQRELGVDTLREAMRKKVSHHELEYLFDNVYPFLQLVSSDADFNGVFEPQFHKASTGWIVHDYGDAVSVSAPHDVTEGEEGGGESGSGGTIIGQQAITAAEIVQMINNKGWTAIELIAGTKMMERFLWVAAKQMNITVNGYTPSADDERCYVRMSKIAQAEAERRLEREKRFAVAAEKTH